MHLGRARGLHPVSVALAARCAVRRRRTSSARRSTSSARTRLDWATRGALDRAADPAEPAWTWHNAATTRDRPDVGRQPGDPALEPGGRPMDRGRSRRTPGACCCSRPPRSCPRPREVFRMLRNMGERGLLEQFPAVVVATAKAGGPFSAPLGRGAASVTATTRRAAVLRAMADYNPGAMVVFDVGLRAHRPAVGAAVRRAGDRRRARPQARRALLRGTGQPKRGGRESRQGPLLRRSGPCWSRGAVRG